MATAQATATLMVIPTEPPVDTARHQTATVEARMELTLVARVTRWLT